MSLQWCNGNGFIWSTEYDGFETRSKIKDNKMGIFLFLYLAHSIQYLVQS